MAQAKQKKQPRRSQRGASRGLPGWAMLTIGLIIGLFVAFLVYLDDLQKPPNAAVQEPEITGGQAPGSDSADANSADEDNDQPAEPDFEFYSILPDLEVVVPDHKADQQESQTATSAGDADKETGASESTTPQPSSDRAFYLQAGSFQQSAEADQMRAKISLLGLDVSIHDVTVKNDDWHRVRVGPYTDPDDLRKAKQRLHDNDIDFLVLRRKSSG